MLSVVAEIHIQECGTYGNTVHFTELHILSKSKSMAGGAWYPVQGAEHFF